MKTTLIIGVLLLFALTNGSEKLVEVGVPIAVLLPNFTIGAIGRCTSQAIRMAISDVNSVKNFIVHNTTDNSTNHTIVTSYKLEPYLAQTMHTVGDAIEALHSLYKNKTKISTIGPPFKDQNEYITEYTTAKANVHVSYSEANEPTENYFIMHFRTPPSISSSFHAATSLLKEFNWKKTGMLYDYSDFRYRKNVDKLRDIITKRNDHNNTIIADQGIWSIPVQYSVSKELSVLQDRGVRIILTLVGITGARKIFCEAYKRNMYQPKVTWILFETLPADWASDKYNAYKSRREIECTEDELLTAANGYISITKQGLRSDNKRTISGMTAQQFRVRLQDSVGHDLQCDENVAYAYDSIWVLAGGYRNMANNMELLQYEYHNFSYSIALAENIGTLNFEALTGPLKYEDKQVHSRLGQTVLWVNHKAEESEVFARHDTASNILELVPDARRIVFKSNIVPKDRAIYIIKNENFNKALLVVMWSFSLLGIVMIMVILVGFIILSTYQYCIFDTPAVDCVLLFGGVLCYLSVIVYSIDGRYVEESNIPKTCTAFLSVLSIGFTLAFGSLFAKTWKLYKMYMTPEMKVDTNKQQEKKEFPEWLLIAMVTSLVVGDMILLTCWIATAPFENQVYNLTSASSSKHMENVIEMEQVIRCRCDNQTQFTIGIYCYKGLLLIFGLFLAWQTRNAKLKCKTESKEIAMAIYNVVAVSVIGVICVSVLANTTRQQATFAIISVCIIICTTTTLMLVFLKKVLQVLRGDLSSFKLDSDRSISSANESPTTKYTLEYMRKPIGTLDLNSRHMSTNTINTQISNESPTSMHYTQCGSAPTPSSIVSVNPSFLHSPPQCIPPPVYSEVAETSGIYVGLNDDATTG